MSEMSPETAQVRCPFERDECDQPECFHDVDECAAAFTASVARQVSAPETDQPREVVETYTVRWAAVAGPIRCVCGHDHYGRVPQATAEHAAPRGNLATQWWFCEDEGCDCSTLRHLASRPGEQA